MWEFLRTKTAEKSLKNSVIIIVIVIAIVISEKKDRFG